LDQVVLRALESQPERRYQHASDVKTAVESIATSAFSGGRAAGWPAAQPGGLGLAPGAAPALLVCAIGMIFSALTMAAGCVVGVYVLLNYPLGSNEFWGWMGGVFGCVIGGGGGLIGSWNSYRQLEGAGDLMQSPDWTWLDKILGGYTAFGLVCIAAGLAV